MSEWATENSYDEPKLYQLILRVYRTHYEKSPDSSHSVLQSALSKALLIDWYNKNFESLGYSRAKPFPQGHEKVEFPGNTGGGCFSVSCTVSIKELALLSAAKGD